MIYAITIINFKKYSDRSKGTWYPGQSSKMTPSKKYKYTLQTNKEGDNILNSQQHIISKIQHDQVIISSNTLKIMSPTLDFGTYP